jgi:hypothetical protein
MKTQDIEGVPGGGMTVGAATVRCLEVPQKDFALFFACTDRGGVRVAPLLGGWGYWSTLAIKGGGSSVVDDA